jgi:hypothetical protein
MIIMYTYIYIQPMYITELNQTINNLINNNNKIYKLLIELESELKLLKEFICTIKYP